MLINLVESRNIAILNSYGMSYKTVRGLYFQFQRSYFVFTFWICVCTVYVWPVHELWSSLKLRREKLNLLISTSCVLCSLFCNEVL